MKKRISIVWLIIGAIFFWTATAPAKPITLRFADQNPEQGWGVTAATGPLLQKIEAATKGQVKIQPYYSQTLCKGKDAWNAAQVGITDMAWCFHGYWADMTPLTDVISLPGLPFNTAQEGSAVLWRIYEKFPEIQKEFDKVKVLLFYTSEPYSLNTRKKQVKSLEDLKGMKIRMTGGPPTEMMKALGGVPLLIPMPDNYISLQKGVMDGCSLPWEGLLSWRLYEVVDYTTVVPFPAVYFSVVMNLNKWNSLTEEVQNNIMSVCGLEGSKFCGHNYFDRAKEKSIEKAKAEGFDLNIYELSKEERDRWMDVGVKPIWEAWITKMEQKGHSKAREILESVLAMGEEVKLELSKK